MPALKSSGPTTSKAQQKGRWAEARVRRHFKNLKLLSACARTPFAEVDLIFQKRPGLLLVIEVKTLSRFDFLATRISAKQKQRLYRACEYLREKSRQDVELNWAFVTADGEVLVIDEVRG